MAWGSQSHLEWVKFQCLLGHDIDMSICVCSICIHMWEHVYGEYHTYGKRNGDTS